jgi:flagellar basal-body rod modification protein FlgD
MEINQTTAQAAATSLAGTGDIDASAISSDFETFLKMMTAQIENQDPLDPIDSADYAVQLATFSAVEQQVLTNDLLTALGGQLQLSGLAEMAGWVGMEARAASPAYFDGSPIMLAPNPAAVADKVELVVYDSNGDEVQRTEIAVSAEPLEWAGVDELGNPYDEGVYSFEVISYADDEVLLSDLAEVYATVQEVRSEGGVTVLLMEGGVTIPTTSVSALRRP